MMQTVYVVGDALQKANVTIDNFVVVIFYISSKIMHFFQMPFGYYFLMGSFVVEHPVRENTLFKYIIFIQKII